MLINIRQPKTLREWQSVISLDELSFTRLCSSCNEMYLDLHGYTYEKMLSVNPNGQNAGFKTLDELVFATLLVLKSGITFDLFGYLFNLNQSNAHRKFEEGLQILHQTLEIEGYLPYREFDNIVSFQTQFKKGETLILDGTEQRIQRPSNNEVQKDFYSGKKKTHTVKSLIISTFDKYIHYVSFCWIGKTHDFTVLKEEFPPEEKWFEPFNIRLDLGYQGFQKEYANVELFIPHKKPKGGALTVQQKEENKELAKQRISVEHSLAGLKRYDMLSNVCRLHDWNTYDTMLGVAAGLWNFYISR